MAKKKKLEDILGSLNEKKVYIPKFGVIVNVELDTGFINLLQTLLLSLLQGIDAHVLKEAYKKIDIRVTNYSKELEKEEKDREFKPEDFPPLTQLENDIYTVTSLITNIKAACFEQDLMLEQDPMDPKDISPLMEAFTKNNPEKYNEELMKIAEKYAEKASS